MSRGSSLIITVAGVLAQLAGLALDAVLHARDAALAAREGPFTLSNPGHLLFTAGLAVTVFGLSAALLGPASDGLRGGQRGAPARVSAGGSRALRSRLPAVLCGVAVLVLAGGVFAVTAGAGEHVHQAAGSAGRTQHDGTSISWEQLREIDRMLTLAKEATEKYRDVRVARADGYRQVTAIYPGTGAHFADLDLLAAGTFHVTRPTALQYARGADGGFELVGVAWVLPGKADDSPPSFFAPLGQWHFHDEHARCFRRIGQDAFSEFTAAAACAAAGGVFVEAGHWMLHAWLFRPSPDGVFAAKNWTIAGVHPFD